MEITEKGTFERISNEVKDFLEFLGTFLSISNFDIPNRDASLEATVSYNPCGISPGVSSTAKESVFITIGSFAFLSNISPR